MRYVLYDDDCQFCSNLVEKISSLVEDSVILFFSFNSLKGKEIMSSYNIQDVDSVSYIDHLGKIFFKATAVLNICKFMKFPYNLLVTFNILPNYFLNLVYNLIARNRMKI